jgi:hypothetical protein
VKYLDFVDVEAFQGTITAFGAPKEFASCEGLIKDAAIPGMYIPFGSRSKFSVTWRTKIANEPESTDFAYKLHILYNAMVMPTPRAWQTLSDTTSPDTRSFTVKATPACARWSYVVFDSRECDLSLLEAQLYAGVLPSCGTLGGYVLPPPGGGGGGGSNPDAGCTYLLEDFESYLPGQELDVDAVDTDPDTEELIHGVINDGLDIQELPANGTFTVNDSTATVVGTGAVLADDDDASYIDGPNGDLGYTIALPQLVGYVDGATLELHIRLSITGDVSLDDPDGQVDADAQVFITTDATGDDAVGGFSDGNDNGMSFVVQNVDGTIDDYVVPLDLSSWIDTSVDGVAAALTAGAYLNVVALNNNNYDTTPETRVYEASIVMLDNTDDSKSLRVIPGEDEGYVKQSVPSVATPDAKANTVAVDFLVKQKVMDTSGVTTATQPICDWTDLAHWPGTLAVELSGDNPVLVWRNQTDSIVETLDLNLNHWYTASVYWTWGSIEVNVYDQGDPSVSYAHWNEVITSAAPPVAFCAHQTGIVINGDVTYEVSLDNAAMQIHCHEEVPPSEWTCFDLSTAVFFSSSEDTNMEGQYDSGTGRIKSKLDSTSFARRAQFHFPGFVLDPTKTYQFRAVYAAHTYGMGIYQQNPSWESTFWSDNDELISTFADTDADNTVIVTVGPGISQWNQAITDGYQSLIRFDMQTNGDTGTVGGADLISLCYKEVV